MNAKIPHAGPWPHPRGCPQCAIAGLCNACGKPVGLDRCTNGRCGHCHVEHCTPGHGYGMVSALTWSHDSAASGPRERAWPMAGWEVVAYHDGRWEVRGLPIGHALAAGAESGLEAAKAKACAVFNALRAARLLQRF
jgi:hypothetical protein